MPTVRGAGYGRWRDLSLWPRSSAPRASSSCSLLSEKHSADPATYAPRAEWTGAGEGEGAVGTLPVGCASSGSGRGPSPLKWELRPGDGRGRGGLDVPPPTVSDLTLTLEAYLGQGELHGARPGNGAPTAGCVSVLGKDVHTQQLISLTPGPEGRKCRLTHSPSPGRGPASWKAVRHLSLPRKPDRCRWWWVFVSFCAQALGSPDCHLTSIPPVSPSNPSLQTRTPFSPSASLPVSPSASVLSSSNGDVSLKRISPNKGLGFGLLGDSYTGLCS